MYVLLVSSKGNIDFWHFSENPYITWSAELIAKYGNQWNWEKLSMNESIPFTRELLAQFSEQWDWYYLSTNEGVPFELTLMEAFKDKWDFWELSSNPCFLKQVELIGHYQAELKWSAVSLFSPVLDTIENFSRFQALIQPQDFIANKYIHTLNQSYLYETLSTKMDSPLGGDWSTFWRYAPIRDLLKIAPLLLEDFEAQVSFCHLSANPYLPLEIHFFEKYQENWSWKKLSGLHFFDSFTKTHTGWPMEFIERFAEHWDWNQLAVNGYIQWKLPVVLKYLDRIPKGSTDLGINPQHYILKHPNLQVSEDLLGVWDRYFDQLEWGNALSFGGATRLLEPDEIEQILQNSKAP
jgi:hypothetical protein